MTVGDTRVSLELAQARSSGHGWAKATGLRQGTNLIPHPKSSPPFFFFGLLPSLAKRTKKLIDSAR